jgi:putative addiction module component (TIGR02574 family)
MSIAWDDLRKLPIAEKLQLVERLWDDNADSRDPFPVQPWHREEAERRAEELDCNPEIGLTRAEVWKQVGESRG